MNMKKTPFFLFFLMLAVLMNVTSFASVVSDNDGSAFITKAEFDSLKNDFQAQIDQHNTSIDSKIDASIASYLAGISIAKQQQLTNYMTKAKKDSDKNLKFMKWSEPSETRKYVDGYYDVEAAYVVGQIYGVNQGSNSTGSGLYNYINVSNASAWGAQIEFVDYKGTATSNYEYTGRVKDFKSAYYWIKFPFKGEGETYKNTTDWTLKDIYRHRLHMKLEASKLGFSSAQYGSYTTSGINNLTKNTGGKITTDFTGFKQPSIQQGSSQGTQIILTLQPVLTQTHTWSQFDKDPDFSTEDDEKKNKCLEYNLSGTVPSKTIACIEYDKRDYYESGNITRNIMAKPTKSGSDGSRPGTAIGIIWKTNPVYNRRGWNEYYNDTTFEYKYKSPKVYDLNYKNLTNAYYNTLFSEAHYKYYGIPITKVSKKGKLTFYLTFDNSTTDDYKYCIMDRRFDNGDMPVSKKETIDNVSYDRVLKTETIKNAKGEKEVKIVVEKKAIFDKENGDYIYIKIEPSSASQIVSVDCTKSIMLETNEQ